MHCLVSGNQELIVNHFYAQKQLLLYRVLAVEILSVRLSVCLSVTRVDQSKTVQARIT